MEHLIRMQNAWDHQTLLWLRAHVGDEAIVAAVGRCRSPSKPYLSTVCRTLGVTPPAVTWSRNPPPSKVGERSLAAIRDILSAKAASATAT